LVWVGDGAEAVSLGVPVLDEAQLLQILETGEVPA
jgi:hypothetical protein